MTIDRAVAERILAEITARIAAREALLAEGVIRGRWLSDTRHGMRQDREAYAAILATLTATVSE